MSRHAWALLRMADELARDGADPRDAEGELAPDPPAYEYEQLLAAMAERLLGERARRRQLFPGRIFGDCGWDMVLILYRNRVHGRRSVPHNVAMELDCTVREVEALVTILLEEGLVEWCNRFHFIRLSDDGASRVRDFFIDEEVDQKRASQAGNDTLLERQCA